MRRVVMFSGGITSWATARWVADTYGTADMVLLFADVLREDEDLHRFNADAARDIGIPLTTVCDGRTPEQVDVDRRWLSNSQVAQCSLELKIKPCRAWLDGNTDPADTVIYLGIDWSELHRLPGQRAGYAHPSPGTCRHRKHCRSLFDEHGRLEGPGCRALLDQPWVVDAPLTRPPYADKRQLILSARERGIVEPRLYGAGFPHNNCGGTCIKAGIAQWEHLLRVFPDRYAAKEEHEQRMQRMLGKPVTILTRQMGKATVPLSLAELRTTVEAGRVDDLFGGLPGLDWGGCGCFTEAVTA